MRYSVLLPISFRSDSFRLYDWLRTALRSVAGELDGTSYEVVVIDDGSTPQIEPYLSNMPCRDRMRILRNDTNCGLIRSLNRGLAVAEGEFILRIDADDWWEPGRISHQLAQFENDTSLALSFGSMNLVNEKGIHTETHIRSFDWREALEFSQSVGCAIPHGSICVRKSVLQALGGYLYTDRSQHVEDFFLWARLMRFFKVKGEPEIYLNYRVHDKSVSAINRAVQSANTAFIQDALRRVGPAASYVSAMEQFTGLVGGNAVELGMRLHDLWLTGGTFALPASAVLSLRRLLFDRWIEIASEEGEAVVVRIGDL